MSPANDTRVTLALGMLLIGLPVGATILQAACTLYNKLAGVSAPPDRLSWKERRLQRKGVLETGFTAELPRRFAPSNANTADFEDTNQPIGVPSLSLGQAVSIPFLSAIFSVLVGFLINKALGGPGVMGGRGSPMAPLIASFVALVVYFLAMSALLPTSFGRGLLITLLYMLLGLVLCIVLAAILFAIGWVFAAGTIWAGDAVPVVLPALALSEYPSA